MTVSVIVLSHQPGPWLEPCLASVVPQADEVLLVDNASPNHQASEIGRRWGVKVLPSETNLGFAGGVNVGLASARGDLVALLNDDAVAGPGWLDAAAKVLVEPSIAAVTPKVLLDGWYREVLLDDEPLLGTNDHRRLGRQLRSVLSGGVDVLDRLSGAGIHELEQGQGRPADRWRWTVPGKPFYVPIPDRSAGDDVVIDGQRVGAGAVCRLINKAGSYLQPDGVLGDHGAETPDDGRWDHPAERFFASGTALVARAETFRRVGVLAEPYFAYYEDGDWSWRARLAGMRLVYDPAAVVDHRLSATSRGPSSAFVRYLAERNRILCLVRNAPLDVAARFVGRRITGGPGAGARRGVLAKLPWAAGSRLRLSRQWVVRPEEVWERWAGADLAWDDGPCSECRQ